MPIVKTKPMRKILSTLVLLFFVFAVAGFSQENPKDDAYYFSIVKEYTLNPDGSMIYHYSKDQKLLTYRAFNSFYGETFVVYHPQFQTLVINESSTTMADGKKVRAPANAFNEVLPGNAANAPSFNMLREMVITHTALERNAVIHLDYTLRSEKGFLPALAGDELLAESEPVKSLILRVKIPASTVLSYEGFNNVKAPVKTTEGNFLVYTWQADNIPPLSAEENQAGGAAYAPRVIFSSKTDAETGWQNFVSQPAFSYGLNESMKKETGKRMAENTDNTLLALKIQEMVVNEVNLTPVPMRYTGFRLRTPEQVWAGNYGTLPEKAVLMTSLLRFAGFDALPVAVLRSASYSDKIANLSGIEEVIVKAVTPDGIVLWLSAASLNPQDLSITLPGRVFIPLASGVKLQPVSTGTTPAGGSLTGNLYLNEKNELSGEVAATVSGPFNPQYALLRDQARAKQWISGGLGGKEMKEVKSAQPGAETSTFTFQVQKDNAFKKDSLLNVFTLPFLSGGIESWGIRLLPSDRSTPFEIPYPVKESVELTLTIPDHLSLLSPENEVSFSNAAGSFRFGIKQESGKILISKEISFRNRTIDPKDYAAFKTLVDNWNVPQSREVIFRAK